MPMAVVCITLLRPIVDGAMVDTRGETSNNGSKTSRANATKTHNPTHSFTRSLVVERWQRSN
jgi:hypothetical protein